MMSQKILGAILIVIGLAGFGWIFIQSQAVEQTIQIGNGMSPPADLPK